MMNVYVNTMFKGHWPVGVSAVVIAENEYKAADLLDNELSKCGLTQVVNADDMKMIAIDSPKAFILQDGDY